MEEVKHAGDTAVVSNLRLSLQQDKAIRDWDRDLLISLARSNVKNGTKSNCTRFKRRVENARWRLWGLDRESFVYPLLTDKHHEWEQKHQEEVVAPTKQRYAHAFLGDEHSMRNSSYNMFEFFHRSTSAQRSSSGSISSTASSENENEEDDKENEEIVVVAAPSSPLPLPIPTAKRNLMPPRQRRKSISTSNMLLPLQNRMAPSIQMQRANGWICPLALCVDGNKQNKASKRLFERSSRSLKQHFLIKSGGNGEKRFLLLTDNFLLEFASRKNASPIGFAPLVDVTVSLSEPDKDSIILEIRQSNNNDGGEDDEEDDEEQEEDEFDEFDIPHRIQSLHNNNTVRNMNYGTPDRSSTMLSASSRFKTRPSTSDSMNRRKNKARRKRTLELVPLATEKSDTRLLCQKWVARIQGNGTLAVQDLYEIHGSSIGQGRYAKVHRATRRIDGRSAAVKVVNKADFWELVGLGQERADALCREINTHVYLTRCVKGVVPVHRVFETKQTLVIEMELLDQQNLHQVLLNNKLSESRCADIMIGLLLIVQNLQRHRVCHRDIKLSNIMWASEQEEVGSSTDFKFLGATQIRSGLRLVDFGMAAYVNQQGYLRGRCGTPGYVAPEILLARPGTYYKQGVDMFSLGVVCYTILCGYEPFQRDDIYETLRANKNCEFAFHPHTWSSISNAPKDFVRKLLTNEPDARLTPEQALNHPWLRSRRIKKHNIKIPALDNNSAVSHSPKALQNLNHPLQTIDQLSDSNNNSGCIIT